MKYTTKNINSTITERNISGFLTAFSLVNGLPAKKPAIKPHATSANIAKRRKVSFFCASFCAKMKEKLNKLFIISFLL